MRTLSPSLLVCCALALGATSSAAAQEAPPSRFSGVVDVTTVNVDVVATRHGEPVTDLTAADFTVFEDGVGRELTNFARIVDGVVWLGGGERGAGEGAAPERPLRDVRYRGRVVLLFDLNNTTRPRLTRALEAAQQYVEAHAAEDLDWSVAVVGTAPRVALAYTADTTRVVAALASLADETTYRDLGALDRSQVYEPLRSESAANLAGEPPGTGGGWGGRAAQEAMAGFGALTAGTESLRALGRLGLGLVQILEGSAQAPGKKVCLVFTGGLDVGLDAQASEISGRTASIAQRRRTELHDLQRQIEGLVEKLGHLASTAGFTLYTVNTAGLQQPSLEFAAENGGRTSLRDETSGPSSLDPTSPNSDPDAIPRALAEEAGGRHFTGNDIGTALEGAHQAATTYYSLGFASEPRGEGTYRKINVKVNRPGVHLEFRPGRYERDPENGLVDRLAAPLSLQQGNGAVPVEVTAFSRPGSAGLEITVTLKTPLDRLTLLPEQDGFAAELALLLAVYDEDGRILDLKRQQQRVAVPTDRLTEAQGQPFSTALSFTLPEGNYTVSMALLDRGAGTWGLGTTQVEPAPPEATPAPAATVSHPAVAARPDEPLETRLAEAEQPQQPVRKGLSPQYADWPAGPEGVLLTTAERKAWAALDDDDAARDAIGLFWARRDPDASTPDNEARNDFEARIAAADEQFTLPEQRGALSDRGRVLLLLGRPASVIKASDLTGETWFYGRGQLPSEAPIGRREKRLKVPFRRDDEGEMRLAPDDDAVRRVIDGTLAAARAAWIVHPELTRAPMPALFLSAPTASAEELAATAVKNAPWPKGAVAAAVPELFPGQNPRMWVTLSLPSSAAAGDGLAGLLMDAERQPLGTFHIPAQPLPTARGTVYQLSLPVTRGSTRLRLGLFNGGNLLACTELALFTPAPPPNATWIAPVVAGAELGRQQRFRPWDPFLYGGHRLIPRLEGRYAADETLYWFTEVLRPGHRPADVPKVDVDIEVLRGTRVVAAHRESGLELSMMAPDAFIVGSSIPLAALPGAGVYRLAITVTEPMSGVSRTTELPLVVEPSGPAGGR